MNLKKINNLTKEGIFLGEIGMDYYNVSQSEKKIAEYAVCKIKDLERENEVLKKKFERLFKHAVQVVRPTEKGPDVKVAFCSGSACTQFIERFEFIKKNVLKGDS